ncbi:MAG: hypothetical protein U1D30_07495 [Planctomycetota bacterium]
MNGDHLLFERRGIPLEPSLLSHVLTPSVDCLSETSATVHAFLRVRWARTEIGARTRAYLAKVFLEEIVAGVAETRSSFRARRSR